MSIEDLCTGDQVYVNTQSDADDGVGWMGGDDGEWSADAGDPIDCRQETPSANDIQRYAADGMRLTHRFYFFGDRGLTRNSRLHWTLTNEEVIDRYVTVLAYYREDTPDDDPDMELWIADCSEETTRNDDDEATA